jgi:hypothetical protein
VGSNPPPGMVKCLRLQCRYRSCEWLIPCPGNPTECLIKDLKADSKPKSIMRYSDSVTCVTFGSGHELCAVCRNGALCCATCFRYKYCAAQPVLGTSTVLRNLF